MYFQEMTTSPYKEKSKLILLESPVIKTMWKAGYGEFGYLKLSQPASNFYV